MIIFNKEITTPIETLLNSLQHELYVRHIDKLNKIEIRGNNARICCPFHKDGHERTPSCDILLYDKPIYDYRVGKNVIIPRGTVNCFACGYKANFVKFIADCLDESFSYSANWIINNSEYNIVKNNRYIPELDISKDIVNNNYSELPEVTQEELLSYEYIHPYMFKRHLTDYVIKKFDVGYDPKTDSLTFPVYVDGQCLFIAKRRVSYKRFDMPKIEPKPIYGLDYVKGKEIYVCESIINCLTLWSWGYEAVCLFGTGSAYQIEQLSKLNIRSIVLALDGDTAGRNGTNKIKYALKDKMVTILNIPEGKDINDLTKDEFENIKNSSFIS